MKRVGFFIAVALVILFFFWVYQRHEAVSHLGDGAVTARDGSPISGEPQGTGGGKASNQPPASEKAQIAQDSQTSSLPATAPTSGAGTVVPAKDTVAPNPPNGLAFGGTGRFQWYRQDNLTWRVDTNNGEACIAFATMEEWRKPIVYSHGCGNS
jgi:hypothetical protein